MQSSEQGAGEAGSWAVLVTCGMAVLGAAWLAEQQHLSGWWLAAQHAPWPGPGCSSP